MSEDDVRWMWVAERLYSYWSDGAFQRKIDLEELQREARMIVGYVDGTVDLGPNPKGPA